MYNSETPIETLSWKNCSGVIRENDCTIWKMSDSAMYYLLIFVFNPFRPAPRSKSVKNSRFIYSFSLDHGYCQNPIKNFKKLILGQIWTCCLLATSGRKDTRKWKSDSSSI